MDSQQPGSTFIDYELKKSSGELVWSVLGHSNELDVISVGQLALTLLSGEAEAAAHWRPVTGLALTWHSNTNLLPAKTVCRERVAICLTLALLYLSHKDFHKQGSAITETSIKFGFQVEIVTFSQCIEPIVLAILVWLQSWE